MTRRGRRQRAWHGTTTAARPKVDISERGLPPSLGARLLASQRPCRIRPWLTLITATVTTTAITVMPRTAPMAAITIMTITVRMITIITTGMTTLTGMPMTILTLIGMVTSII